MEIVHIRKKKQAPFGGAHLHMAIAWMLTVLWPGICVQWKPEWLNNVLEEESMRTWMG